ncbi:MAG: NnrS family protein [Dehalococcoidia bacterium]
MEERDIEGRGWQSAVWMRGFRPFFLLAAAYAVISAGVWLATLEGWLATPGPLAPPWWHAHEMIYGFVSAAIAGFLLTSDPVWTGSRPLVGGGLAAMALLWAAGRACMALSGWLPAIAVALVDLAFLPALVIVLASPILAARSRRNYGIPVVLLLLALANGLIHLQALGWSARSAPVGLRFAVDLIALLVVVVGGRITPNFTENAFRRAGLDVSVRPSSWLDRLGLASVVLLLVIDLVAPRSLPGGVVGLLAAGLTAARMFGWQTHRTLRDPLVWSLHLGYAWVPVGLACRAIGVKARFGVRPSIICPSDVKTK